MAGKEHAMNVNKEVIHDWARITSDYENLKMTEFLKIHTNLKFNEILWVAKYSGVIF